MGGAGIYSATTFWAHTIIFNAPLSPRNDGGTFSIPHPQQSGPQSICGRPTATANCRGERQRQLPPLLPPPLRFSLRLSTSLPASPALLPPSPLHPPPTPHCPSRRRARLRVGSPRSTAAALGGREAAAATAVAESRLCQLCAQSGRSRGPSPGRAPRREGSLPWAREHTNTLT